MTQKQIKSRTKKMLKIRPIHLRNPVLSLDLAPDLKATTTTSGGSWNSVTFNSNVRAGERLADWPMWQELSTNAGLPKFPFNLFICFIFVLPSFFLGGLHVKAKQLFICFSKAVVLLLARPLTIIVLPSHEQHNSSGGMRRISCWLLGGIWFVFPVSGSKVFFFSLPSSCPL